MFVGGYQIIDLGGADLGETAVTVPGVFATIEGTQKPIRVCNFTFGGSVQHAIQTPVTLGENSVTLHAMSFNITVTDEDAVTAAAS